MSQAPAEDEGNDDDPDWAGVFLLLMQNANMSYEDVCNRTIVQINGIIDSLSEQVEKNEEGQSVQKPEKMPDKLPTKDDLDSFCASFAGMNK